MKIALFFLYLFLCSSALSLLFKQKIERTISLAIFIHVFVLYLFGVIFDSLLPGLYACYFLGALSLIYLAYSFIARRGTDLEQNIYIYILRPGMLLYAIAFVLAALLNYSRVFMKWDEFSHWGLVVKNMYIFDRFGTYEYSTVLFKSYLPGVSLWEYFVVKFMGSYDEAYVYYAMDWLIFSMLVAPLDKFSLKQLPKAAIFLLGLIWIPSIFDIDYLKTVYVDTVLGISFGYLAFMAFDSDRHDAFYWLSLFFGLTFLCLIKDSGFSLALMLCGTIIVEALAIKPETDKNVLRRIAPAVIFGALAIILGKGLWSLHLSADGVSGSWNTGNISLPAIIELFKGESPDYYYDVVRSFFTNVFVSRFPLLYVHITSAELALAPVAAFALGCYFTHKNRSKALIYTVSCVLYFVLYTIGMLFSYVFMFSRTDAIELASIARYLSTCQIALLFFGASSMAEICAEYKPHRKAEHAAYALLWIALLVLGSKYIYKLVSTNEEHIQNAIASREPYVNYISSEYDKYLESLDYRENRLLIYGLDNSGKAYYCIHYLLTPIKLIPDVRGFSDAGEWLDMLNEAQVTNVYLPEVSESFLDAYSSCFSETPEAGVMYRLDGRQLVPIQN